MAEDSRQIAETIRGLPADPVIDGEVVALHESGGPDFHRCTKVLVAGQFPGQNLLPGKRVKIST